MPSHDVQDLNSILLIEQLKDLYNQPLKIYNEDLENLKFGYTNREITQQMLKTALERGEITIHDYINIIKQ